jgi:hypothetical protein
MDSKTKLAKFYEKHDKMFKKRAITVAREINEINPNEEEPRDPNQEEPHDPD